MREFKRSLKGMISKVVVMCMVLAMTMGTVLAAEGDAATFDTAAISTAFTTGFTSMVTMSIQLITSILPIAITLFGVMFLVKKAPKWFQKMTG